MTGVIFQRDKELCRNDWGVSTELKARHTNVEWIIIIYLPFYHSPFYTSYNRHFSV